MDEFQFRLSPKRGNGYLTFFSSSAGFQLGCAAGDREKKKRNICEHENPKIQKFTRPRKNEIK
jgi:hypothetical protein